MKKQIAVLALPITLFIGGVFYQHIEQTSRQEAYLNSLVEAERHASGRLDEVSKDYKAKSRNLERLWLERNQRNVVDELVPLINDTSLSTHLRDKAVSALGRIEDPSAEAALARLQDQQRKIRLAIEEYTRDLSKNVQVKPLPPLAIVDEVTLKIALARIRGHGLQGRDRVEALIKPFDLSWNDLVKLSRKVNVKRRAFIRGSDGDTLVEEVVDVLYCMQKEGQNVDGLVSKLTLNPEQKVKLEAGKLNHKAEIAFLIDYLAEQSRYTYDHSILAYHLAGLGPDIVKPLVQKLNEIKSTHPIKRTGYTILYRAAMNASSSLQIGSRLKEVFNRPLS